MIALWARYGFNSSGTKRQVGSLAGKQTHQKYPQVLEKFKYTSLALYGVDSWQNQEVFVEVHPVITQARKGDLIRVIRHVKGLDEKDIENFYESSEVGALAAVRAFRMTLQHKSIEGQKEVKKITCST